jgi:hypothetical protein
MKTVRYTTVVDADVRYPAAKFADEVAMYLADPDGWESRGYTFEAVDRQPEVVIHLASPATLLKSGCRNAELSCAELGGRVMMLNAMRWTQGAPASKLPLEEYRQYLVSHEMGHILGHDHVKCPAPNHPAPVMMQQTLGIGACAPNTKVRQSY